MGILERIKEIEDEMARTQKNKATNFHLGQLKGRLAQLRTQLLEPTGKGAKGEGFDVGKYGNARVCMIGFPSVGKSTLLSTLTETQSLAAAYEFTTLTCIPGIIHYNDAKIQLLDLPGIIEGAAEGKGKGRQVIAVAKNCDAVLMVLEAAKADDQKRKLTRELEKVGIRLNRRPPNVTITNTKGGGVKLNSLMKLTHLDEKMVKNILSLYKIHNADVLCREDINVDDFIDVVEGNRKYLKCLYVYNKIDTISLEEVDEIARRQHNVVISCQMKLNLDYLLEKMWEYLDLTRVYTKKKGMYPDFGDPIILTSDRNGNTVQSICDQIHKDFVKDFKYANIWGKSVRHMPQRCGLNHQLKDEDVIQLFKNTSKKTEQPKKNENLLENKNSLKIKKK